MPAKGAFDLGKTWVTGGHWPGCRLNGAKPFWSIAMNRDQTPMSEIVHDLGSDVDTETIAISMAPGDSRALQRHGILAGERFSVGTRRRHRHRVFGRT
jgi:hypothetical protein